MLEVAADSRARLGQLDSQVPQEAQVSLEHLDLMDSPDQLDLQDHLVSREIQEPQEILDLLDQSVSSKPVYIKN